MSLSISVLGNFSDRFYSAYRPIILTVEDSDNDTAYLRAELYMETYPQSLTFASTGVLLNGYSDIANPDRFSFNLMEYVRDYVSQVSFHPIHYTLPGSYDVREFYVKVWAVKYSSQQYGKLYDDDGNSIKSRKFIATGLVTSELDSMDTADSYLRANRYVLGANSNWGNVVDSHLPSTNAPNRYPKGSFPNPMVVQKDYLGSQTININDAPVDSLYFNVSLDSTYTRLIMSMNSWELGSSSSSYSSWEVFPGGNTFWRQPLHPEAIEYEYLMSTGSVLNKLIHSANGELKAGVISIMPLLANSNLSQYKRLSNMTESNKAYNATFIYWYSDEVDNGNCRIKKYENSIYGNQGGEGGTRTKFVFKNMRGGYDFFNCYGTHSKEISVGGTMFDNHKMWGARSAHSRKSLWTTREDIYSVITQPLPTEDTIWLEQLITSPQVWVQKEVKNSEGVQGAAMLFAVNIDKESYTVHNSEDNIHYMSFKYKLSEPVSTQKG